MIKEYLQKTLSSLPSLSSWLTRVMEELPDLATRLQQLHQCQPKQKDESKTPKGRGEGKGKGPAREKTVAPAAPRKLKLLCLHGYRQSGKAAREKLGSFRKAVNDTFEKKKQLQINSISFQVGKVAELDFVTAPHIIPGEEEQYGWWFSKVAPLYFYIY